MLKRFLPQHRAMLMDKGFVTSWRWLSWRVDGIKSPKGFWFVQYGKNRSLRFVLVGKALSAFAIGGALRTTFKRGSIRVGTITHPININAMWRANALRA